MSCEPAAQTVVAAAETPVGRWAVGAVEPACGFLEQQLDWFPANVQNEVASSTWVAKNQLCNSDCVFDLVKPVHTAIQKHL